MNNCGDLALFGFGVLFLTAALIVVPYLRRKSELLSGWNMLLIGVALFLGFGSLEAAYSPIRFQGLQWFQPTRPEALRFVAYSTVFLISLISLYYYDPTSKAFAARAFNKWPPITNNLLLCVLGACFIMAVAAEASFLLRIKFIG